MVNTIRYVARNGWPVVLNSRYLPKSPVAATGADDVLFKIVLSGLMLAWILLAMAAGTAFGISNWTQKAIAHGPSDAPVARVVCDAPAPRWPGEVLRCVIEHYQVPSRI